MSRNLIEMNGPGVDRNFPDNGNSPFYAYGQGVTVAKATFGASIAAGALITALADPFGSGSTFSTVGTVPGQLALSSGTIVKGASAAVAGTTYSIFVKAAAADGVRQATTRLDFDAL